MMFDIAGGIILACIGLSLLNLMLGLTWLSFQSEDGRQCWAIMGIIAAAWLLATLFGAVGALIDFALAGVWIWSRWDAIRARYQANPIPLGGRIWLAGMGIFMLCSLIGSAFSGLTAHADPYAKYLTPPAHTWQDDPIVTPVPNPFDRFDPPAHARHRHKR
jgi:hypothetical protein